MAIFTIKLTNNSSHSDKISMFFFAYNLSFFIIECDETQFKKILYSPSFILLAYTCNIIPLSENLCNNCSNASSQFNAI